MSDSYLAHWSRGRSGKLIVTDRAGREVDSFEIPSEGDRPGPGLFCGAVWAPFPGSEWEEEPPGQWSVAVFNDKPERTEGLCADGPGEHDG